MKLARQRLAPAALGQEPGGVGAHTEECGMAERDDPRVAEEEIERQREERGDGDLARELEVGREEEEGRQRGEPEDRLQAPPSGLARELVTRVRGRLGGAHPSAGRTGRPGAT